MTSAPRARGGELVAAVRRQFALHRNYGADETERFQAVMERLKPLSVGGLVTSYEKAVAQAAQAAKDSRRR